MGQPIRIHFPNLRDDETVVPLAAALGLGPPLKANGVDAHRFERLVDEAAEHWQVAESYEQAELVVYPHNFRSGPDTSGVSRRAKEAGLPCVFFLGGDDATPVHVEHGLVYRESMLADQRDPCERVMPAFCDDLLRERGGQVTPRPKQQTPSVGFCGYTGTAFSRLFYRLTGRRAKVMGLDMRLGALRALERTRGISCRFVKRAQFWGGAFGRFRKDEDRAAHVRREYVDNLFGNDYTLCMRGAGNFSYRLYETLAAGRIPLFINTKCVLPFEEEIDWRKHCVWVEERDLERAGEILAGAHAAMSADQFIEMQHANRRLWEQRLSPLGFYRRLTAKLVGREP